MKRHFRYMVMAFLLIFITSSCEDDDIQKEYPEPKATIMIVPDIQNYTNNEKNLKYLTSIVDYYKTNQRNFDVVLQVGDLTYNNEPWQYENAYKYFISQFDENDQMVYCLGNHDYGSNGSSDKRISNIQDYMLPIYDFKMDGTAYENYVKHVIIGGVRYGVLVLEFATRNETLEWANQVISKEPDIPYILMTHAFLNYRGKMFDVTDPTCDNSVSPKNYRMGENYKNDSKEIFDKLIDTNSNVKLVICGHSLTPDYINVLSKNNSKGEPVYMVMVNYQDYTDGGQGYVGLLNITDGFYRIRSYSTFKKEFGNIDIDFGDTSKISE